MIKMIKTFIRVICFLFLLILCLWLTNKVLMRKETVPKMADFFSQKEDFDVLFLGSSHVKDGIYPMELWEDYGIVSYNLANTSETVAVSYWNMLLALKETNPKLVVIDTYLLNNKVVYKESAHYHNTFDVYDMSLTKYQAIKDLFGDDKLLDYEVEFMLPISLYHSRWDSLKQADFETKVTYEKGATSYSAVAKPIKVNNFKSVEAYSGEELPGMIYLRKIIEYCKDNNIQVLVTHLPYPASTDRIANSKYVSKICDEYQVDYINFLGMNVVDYNIDLYDTSSHLNVSGARKVTDYLGKYIQEKYGITSKKNDSKYSYWHNDYNEYIDFKIARLKENANDLNSYLSLLYDENDIKYEVTITNNYLKKSDEVLKKLLKNLTAKYSVVKNSLDDETKNVKIVTYDNRDGSVIQTVYF